MTMTRQDFELIARTISDLDSDTMERGDFVAHLHVAQRFANAFAATTPRFDRERFLRACGVEV